MNYTEIKKYLDTIPFLRLVEVANEGSIYCVDSISLYEEDRDADLPYSNNANVIILDNTGICCRRLRILNGLMFAREIVEVSNMTELKDFLETVSDTIDEFNKKTKEYKLAHKLKRIKKHNVLLLFI